MSSMPYQANLPPSEVARLAKLENSEEPKKQSREEWRKMKELEEMRKAGTAPAMKDEEGKDINPHIPQYIMQAPWYFGSSQATLRHQRIQEEKSKVYNKMNDWYKKGVKTGLTATKYRKGACENCGAITHVKKDCLERPRKVGAKFTGDDIAPDEYIQPQLDFDYDGKRDRWNGYDLDEHQAVIDEFAQIEDAKRLLKEQKLDQSLTNKVDEGDVQEESQNDSDNEDKYADDVAMPGQKFETKQRITVRNLRIREDTAKYLYNLDPNSAYYDPKTRSMRENPFINQGKDSGDLQYAGDNFVRYSGDAQNMAKQQMFAWEAYEQGADVHLQADPTKLALLKKEVMDRKDNFKTDQRQTILDKYGGEQHLDAPPKQLLLAQTEDYVEYSRQGTVIKGQEKSVVRSCYEEDVYINNHVSVWGSYWHDGSWGFVCCHSLIKESYCTGEAGKDAAENNAVAIFKAPVPEDDEPVKSLVELHQETVEVVKKSKKKKKKGKKRKKKKLRKHSSSSSEESDSDDGERKLQQALKKEDESQRNAEKLLAMDERKRPYNSMYENKAPTEEELEAYRMKRMRTEDPMSQF